MSQDKKLIQNPSLKFMFSKKATKIDEIFTVDLTLLHNVKSMVKILSIFVAFLENMNFNRLKLYSHCIPTVNTCSLVIFISKPFQVQSAVPIQKLYNQVCKSSGTPLPWAREHILFKKNLEDSKLWFFHRIVNFH